MRLRIAFSKHGKVRFTSHRDVARIWERALRRSALPVAYSEGFNPRPKLSFGLALSTGHESNGEYIDVDLAADAGEIDVASLPSLLTAHLPVGLTATGVVVGDRRMPSLQQAVTSCTWQIDVRDADPVAVQESIDRLLARDEVMITRERKGKEVTDDLRPAVLSLAVDSPMEDGVRLIAELGTQPRAARVSEVLSALDPPLTEHPRFGEHRVLRLHQWIHTDDGQRTDPMTVTAAPSAPLEVSA